MWCYRVESEHYSSPQSATETTTKINKKPSETNMPNVVLSDCQKVLACQRKSTTAHCKARKSNDAAQIFALTEHKLWKKRHMQNRFASHLVQRIPYCPILFTRTSFYSRFVATGNSVYVSPQIFAPFVSNLLAYWIIFPCKSSICGAQHMAIAKSWDSSAKCRCILWLIYKPH